MGVGSRPKGSYYRRKTDGTIASNYSDAPEIEAVERGITRSQLLTTQRYKWITLAEVTPPVQLVEPAPIPDPVPPTTKSGKSGPGSAKDASKGKDVRPPPKSGFETTQTIHNAHYERPNLMAAQISIGFVLIGLGIVFAVLAVLPILLSLGCAAIDGAMLMRGLSNRRRFQ